MFSNVHEKNIKINLHKINSIKSEIESILNCIIGFLELTECFGKKYFVYKIFDNIHFAYTFEYIQCILYIVYLNYFIHSKTIFSFFEIFFVNSRKSLCQIQ